jgi:hypothetical protein
MPKDFYTNCVGVFCKTGSVTHKKDAGSRPIVRSEEIVTLKKLKRTFSMTTFDQDNF